ncbi:hypothetical protein [Rhodopirellula halodulae]|uniref:hypothetical protein n=1 Tax=Rhodopirellula halodulae TaxID=2894198 RepID=UPI001E4C726A|nr:hypothetical protein [Rhodopirellula sp. JC737]MCC9658114.1 hypothetical protein [Rhodopirellula sp. JC737]
MDVLVQFPITQFPGSRRWLRFRFTNSPPRVWRGIAHAMCLVGLFILAHMTEVAHADETKFHDRSQHKQQFVLLRNDRVMTGLVEVTGESIVIHKDGSEIRVPAKDVIGARDDLHALFELRQQWMRPRSSQRPEQRALSAAKWCVDQGLYSEATKQLLTIYQIDPQSREAQQIESRLRHVTKPSVANEVNPSPVQQAGYVESKPKKLQELPAGHSVELISAVSTTSDEVHRQDDLNPIPTSQPSNDSPELDSLHREVMNSWLLHAFTARVQPILLSQCASCHRDGGEASGSLQFVRPLHSSRPNRRITEANLRSALAASVPGSPESSPLIQMAKRKHGSDGPGQTASVPLQGDSVLLLTLESFVAQLPQSVSVSNQPSEPSSSSAAVQPATFVENDETEPIQPSDSLESTTQKTSRSQISTPEATSRPQRLPTVEQPHSKDLFNRQTELLEMFRIGGPTRETGPRLSPR